MKLILFLLLTWLPAASVAADAPKLELSLADAERAALNSSARLKALEAESKALKSRAEGQGALLQPRLNLEGSFRYVTVVPEVKLPVRGAQPMKLGDNESYSVGPALYYTLWENGAARKSWLSVRELAGSKRAEIDAAKRQLVLSTRLDYFQVQAALEQVRLLADSLKVSQAQYRDISSGLEAGARSRLDALSAHQEVLARQKLLNQSRADLAASLRELFALTGLGEGLDPSSPMDARMMGDLPQDMEKATLFLALDPVEASLSRLGPVEQARPDPAHPSLEVYSRLSSSLRRLSESFEANRWPKIQLSAKSSLDYPNGPDLTSFHQNMVAVTASLPLFESGRSKNQAREQELQAQAGERRRAQAETDLRKEWDKAKDQVKWLRLQMEINRQQVAASEEVASLTYSSYQAGRSTFLEVQSANLRALDAKVQAVRTDVQLLAQLTILAGISDAR